MALHLLKAFAIVVIVCWPALSLGRITKLISIIQVATCKLVFIAPHTALNELLIISTRLQRFELIISDCESLCL